LRKRGEFHSIGLRREMRRGFGVEGEYSKGTLV